MKIRLITFFVLLFTLTTKAQTWCPPGATWHYSTFSAYYIDGYTRFKYVGDTVINSISCKQIEQFTEGQGNVLTGYSTISWYSPPSYTYELNGVSYIYNDKDGRSRFDTLFNINANIGDTWRMPLLDTVLDESLYYYEVLDKGQKIINGDSLKWIQVKYHGNPGYTIGFHKDTIIEKVGYRFDLQYLGTDPSTGVFRCYSDSILGFYSPFQNIICNGHPNYVNVTEREQVLNFNLYPNPAKNEVVLNFDSLIFDEYTIEILNGLGQQIEFIKSIKSKNVLDINNYKEGIYFVRVSIENSSTTKKLVVIK